MVCHILCPECCEDLADKYYFFKAVLDEHNKKHVEGYVHKISPDQVGLGKNIIKSADFILDALKLNNICCKHFKNVCFICKFFI